MNWVDVLDAIKHTNPAADRRSLVAQLRPGQQLLFVRPLTEGAQNWQAPWTAVGPAALGPVGGGVANDVNDGMLSQVARAPHNYPGACCVADSAVLYKKLAK